MQKNDPANVWEIRIMGKGSHQPPPDVSSSYKSWEMPRLDGDNPMDPVTFITLSEEKSLNANGKYWGANAAVVGPLTKEVIQPSDFRRSCCGATYEPRKNFLRIFFYSSTYVGRNGYVVVDAPPGFDFAPSCLATDLDETYYAFIGKDEHRLLRLRLMSTCTGSAYPPKAAAGGSPTENRASLMVGGVITNGQYYGFQLKVEHPKDYDEGQHSSWYIWTQESNGYGIEGSQKTVRFNSENLASHLNFYQLSFGMYRDHPSSSDDKIQADVGSLANLITIADLKPSTINSGQATKFSFYYILFDVVTDTSLRITAPAGFRWSNDVKDSENAFKRKIRIQLRTFRSLRTLSTSISLFGSP
jgi:hypothetical protein